MAARRLLSGSHLHARRTAQSSLAPARHSPARSIGEMVQDSAPSPPDKPARAVRTAFTPRPEQGRACRLRHEWPRTAMARHGTRTHGRMSPCSRRMMEACDVAMRPWAKFSLIGRTRRVPRPTRKMQRTGGLAACDLRDANGARGSVAVVGHSAFGGRWPQCGRSRRSLCRRHPHAGSSRERSSCCVVASWTNAQLLAAPCWLSA